MSRPDTETYDKVRQQIDAALTNKDFATKLYDSTNGMARMINAIVKTKGENWAAHVVDDQGRPMLTEAEQQQFTHAFRGYIDAMVEFFGADSGKTQKGAAYHPSLSQLTGLSDEDLKTKRQQLLGESGAPEESETPGGIDNLYSKFIGRMRNVDQMVNDYASKYGVLRLEKEQDLAPDVRLVPETAARSISQGVFTLSAMAGFPIPPDKTMTVLSKLKLPFRTILFAVYLALDVSRISMAVAGRDKGQKILTILLSLLELLRGDWKKAILSFMGYFGMTPLLYGELGKIFLTSFRMISPQLQDSFVFGSFTVAKSFLVGILLAIFQITAPEEVRLPLIGALEKLAQHKAKIDEALGRASLPSRPEYLSPTFEDLNNLQAVLSDSAYICSCEFQKLVDAVNKSSVIMVILQLLNISVSPPDMERVCGTSECQPFTVALVKSAQAGQAPTAEPQLQGQEQEQPMDPGSTPLPAEPSKEGDAIATPPETPASAPPPPPIAARRGGRIIRAKRRALP